MEEAAAEIIEEKMEDVRSTSNEEVGGREPRQEQECRKKSRKKKIKVEDAGALSILGTMVPKSLNRYAAINRDSRR